MIKQILAVLAIGAVTIIPFIDNTDYNPWMEGDTFVMAANGKMNRISRFDPAWKPQSYYESYHEEIYQEQEKQRKEQMKEFLSTTANVCTNGKDHSTMDMTTYINEFIKGPCQPAAIVPGLIGTALQVKIDCETLQAKRSDIFSDCGWQTCSSSKFWLKKPSEEYRIWVGQLTSPFSIAMTNNKEHCFGDFIELYYDYSKSNPQERYTSADGITITWAGNTEKSDDGECGTTAIQEIASDSIIKAAMCDVKGFHVVSDGLKNMGYIPGLTMQAIPYDFRKSIAASESQAYLHKTVDTFYRLTGKKTYIFGHSLGSLHSTQAVYSMTTEQKNKVAGIVTIAGPLLGATKTFKPQVGGDDSFMFNIIGIEAGLNWYTQQKMALTSSSIVDLYPKDTFFRFRNEEWMQQILDRIAWDEEYLLNGEPDTPNPLPWFPTPGEVCGADYENRTNHCQLLMHDMVDHFLQVVDKKYYSTEESTAEAIQDSIPSEAAQRLLQFMEETKREKANNVEHPGVPMVVIYGAHHMTPFRFKYLENPAVVTEKTDNFYLPDEITKIIGDSTVLASSSMTPGIKWVYEHLNGKTTIPTKLVEYCSQYSGDSVSSIYDSKNGSGEKQFTNSGYLGLTCYCKYGQTSIEKCDHACMISDPLFTEFVADILTTNWPSAISQTPATEAELLSIKNGCTNLH